MIPRSTSPIPSNERRVVAGKLSHRIQSLKKMAAKTGEKLNKISA